ncbi:hypothetical protein GLYMA_13G062150v4 [Glycine max]|nr:hypothetical protein GLYMA_13G062150v4 [Glycine max]KAH1100078.1 hypothetical protein GYH30_035308 [Glycine max]
MLGLLMYCAGMPCHVASAFSLYSLQILSVLQNPIRLFHSSLPVITDTPY